MVEYTMVLGDKGLSLGSLATSIIEAGRTPVIITRNNTLEDIHHCILNGLDNRDYTMLTVTEKPSIMLTENDNSDVKVLNCYSTSFEEVVDCVNGGIIFSACRDGLYHTYLPLLAPYITKPTHICVFDNDPAVANTARQMNTNKYIQIHQCVAHSVCSAVQYDHPNHTVYVTCGKDCILIFPPSCYNLENEFKTSPIFDRSEFIFCDTDEMFNYYVTWKLICINSMHSFACVLAYTNGLKLGYSLDELPRKTFSELTDKSYVISYTLHIFSLLYDIHLASYAKLINASKETYIDICTRFLDGLYDHNEYVGRGLDPKHSSFHAKLVRHFPLLKESGDANAIKLLEDFEKALA